MCNKISPVSAILNKKGQKAKKKAKFNNVNKEWFFVHHRKLFFWQIDALVLKLTMDKMDAHTIAHGLKKNAFPSLVSNHFLLQTIFKAFNMTLIAKLPNSSLSTLWFEKKLGFYFDEFLIVWYIKKTWPQHWWIAIVFSKTLSQKVNFPLWKWGMKMSKFWEIGILDKSDIERYLRDP